MTADAGGGVRQSSATFEAFARREGSRLRRVLVAQHGVDTGNDMCAEALRWGWEHRDELARMHNPTGYLYRVAQSAGVRTRRQTERLDFPGTLPEQPGIEVDGDLFHCLAGLSHPQRASVLLVHAHRWTYQEVADVLGISVAAVTNHVHRGLGRLRAELEERS